jgi:hypothetical protein
MSWQARVAELVLLVTALSAESDGAAAVDDVLPSVLLTGANTAAALEKRCVVSCSLSAFLRAVAGLGNIAALLPVFAWSLLRQVLAANFNGSSRLV